MDYEVGREHKQWHIQERGQTSRGMTVTDEWLQSMGFGRLTRRNIQDVVNAVYASHGGVILDEYAARHTPKDIVFVPGFKSYPSHSERGRLPRSPSSG